MNDIADKISHYVTKVHNLFLMNRDYIVTELLNLGCEDLQFFDVYDYDQIIFYEVRFKKNNIDYKRPLFLEQFLNKETIDQFIEDIKNEIGVNYE